MSSLQAAMHCRELTRAKEGDAGEQPVYTANVSAMQTDLLGQGQSNQCEHDLKRLADKTRAASAAREIEELCTCPITQVCFPSAIFHGEGQHHCERNLSGTARLHLNIAGWHQHTLPTKSAATNANALTWLRMRHSTLLPTLGLLSWQALERILRVIEYCIKRHAWR